MANEPSSTPQHPAQPTGHTYIRYTDIDFNQAALDQPSAPGSPRHTYLICAPQRSGSNLLCRQLIHAGLGVPHEYFNPLHARMLCDRWAINSTEHAYYLDTLFERRTTPNGHWSAKLQWPQYLAFQDVIDRQLLSQSQYLYLYRSDVVAQAVSLHCAATSGQWNSTELVPSKVEDNGTRGDISHLFKCLQHLMNAELQWRNFFAVHKIRPLVIEYEDLVEHQAAWIERIGQFLDLEPMRVPPPEVQKPRAADKQAVRDELCDLLRRHIRSQSSSVPQPRTAPAPSQQVAVDTVPQQRSSEQATHSKDRLAPSIAANQPPKTPSKSARSATPKGFGAQSPAGEKHEALRDRSSRAEIEQVFATAVEHHQRQQFEQAQAAYQTVLALDPEHIDALINLGSLYRRMNRLDDAITTYRRALTIQPHSGLWFNLGNTLQDQGEVEEAEDAFRQAIDLQPDLAVAHFNLGRLLQKQDRFEAAVTCYQSAIAHDPQLTRAYTNLGNTFKALEQFDQAVRCHQQAIALAPNDAEAHYNLGNALTSQENYSEAIAAYQQSLRLRPDWTDAILNLANALQADNQDPIPTLQQALSLQPDLLSAHLHLARLFQEQSDFTAAEQQLQQALIHHPDDADVITRLALVLKAQRRFDDAIAQLQQLLAEDPDNASVHCNLGSVYSDQGQLEQAVSHLRRAVQLDPELTQAHINLGHALGVVGQVSGAIEHCQRAISLDPDAAPAYINLGFALTAQGRVLEALESFRTLLKLEPDYHPAHSNFLYALNYDPSYSREEIAAAHLEWGEQEQAKVSHPSLPQRSPNQPLRIGYLSPDFRQHSVAYFIEPILRHHDRKTIEVYCYANVAVPDEVTQRLQELGHQWRDIFTLTDEQVVELIKCDRIDILIDLAGHTGSNRLPVFARKPAPVQATYLGYPNTTGLRAIDYRFTDSWADPPGDSEEYYAETLVHLPQCFLCYQPPSDAPCINKLPALTVETFTFGSCNNLAKLSPEVIKCWATILQAVPHSQLLMKMRCLDDPPTRARFWRLFADHNIPKQRVQLYGPLQDTAQHLAFYHHIDLALDPFPYNGTTTTCESLWMGVPVLTVAGQTHASRVGLSLLTTLDLVDWVTASTDDYIKQAVIATSQLDKLAQLRQELRGRMVVSSLCDAKSQTKILEQQLLQLAIARP